MKSLRNLAVPPLAMAACLAALLAPRRPGAAILDGQPKYVLINNHNSWGLGGALGGGFFASMGLPYLEGGGLGEYNVMPVTDSLTPSKERFADWLTDPAFDKVLADHASKPVILFVDGDPGYGIRSAGDTARINLGVRKLQKLTELLKAKGVSQVFFFSEHYHLRRANDTSLADPNLDSLVINAFNAKTGSHFGVNVTTPTAREFPQAVQSDFEHPLFLTSQIYGTELVRAMCAQDGKAPPLDSMAKAVQAGRDYVNARMNRMGNYGFDPPHPGQARIGSPLTVTSDGINAIFEGVNLRLVLDAYQGGRMQEFILDSNFHVSGGKARATVTLPDSGRLQMYSPVEGMKFPVFGDSGRILVINGEGRDVVYKVTEPFKLLKRDGSPSALSPRRRAGRKVGALPGPGPVPTWSAGRGRVDVTGKVRGPMAAP